MNTNVHVLCCKIIRGSRGGERLGGQDPGRTIPGKSQVALGSIRDNLVREEQLDTSVK